MREMNQIAAIYAIVMARRAGLSVRRSCEVSPVSQAIAYRWLAKGREIMESNPDALGRFVRGEDDEPIEELIGDQFVAFVREMDSALSCFAKRNLDRIAAAAPHDWKAARALLALALPDEYGPRVAIGGKIEHSGSIGVFGTLTSEKADALAERILDEAQGAQPREPEPETA